MGITIESVADIEEQLRLVLGSRRAPEALAAIRSFANGTPWGVSVIDAGHAYIMLASQGIEPTERRLNAFAAHASAVSKSLGDVIEAVADAMVGEPERLKGLGIKMLDDRCAFTYAGRTVEAEKTAASIADALVRLTSP